jgi:hypothetical protein
VAPGWIVTRVEIPEVDARTTFPGQRVRSMFVALSGPAKSAAVVLFHHDVCWRNDATAPVICVFESV